MLPGFRFLFAAIVLSMSILVFGLGATALLRAAHEQFASTPAWRAAPEATFAQQPDLPRDVTGPVLAMLRVEPEPAASDSATTAHIAAPAEADPAPDSRPQADMAATPAEAVADTAPAETQIASTEQAPAAPALSPANDTAPVAAGTAVGSPDNAGASAVDTASARIATLGGPPVAIEAAPTVKAATGAKPDREAVRKHRQARRAAQRRRLAARARAAARLVPTQQTAADPFSQPSAQSQFYAQPPITAHRR